MLPVQTIPWGITKVKSEVAWAAPLSTRGAGVVVAVIDTGVDFNHPEFKANIKVNQSFLTDTDPQDKFTGVWHGTHVSGTVGAIDNTEGVVGVAPSCTLWNLRAGDQNDSFLFTDWLEAIEYAKTNNALIVNNSIAVLNADPVQTKPLVDSVKDGYDRLVTTWISLLHRSP